jgi:hypothetical protein
VELKFLKKEKIFNFLKKYLEGNFKYPKKSISSGKTFLLFKTYRILKKNDFYYFL